MILAEIMLILSIIAAGLFAGLMLTLVVILHRMWLTMPAETYIRSMQTFLPAAKGNPFITTITLLPIIAPIAALVDGRANAGTGAFGLTLIGLILAFCPLLITLRLNFPIYQTMMNWQTASPPANLPQTRTRFQALNLARLLLAVGAMLCFLLALTRAGAPI
jgi:hypothetical protein